MSASGLDRWRLLRTLALIAVVTAVFLLIGAQRLEGVAFQIAAVAIGTVAFVTAITGFLIAGAAYLDDTPNR